MKRILIMLATLAAFVFPTRADNMVTVGETEIPQGGTGSIEIVLNNDEAITAFSMFLELPDGISYVSFDKGARFDDSHSVSQGTKEGKTTFGCLSTSSAPLAGNSGMLFRINVAADASLAVGTKLSATLSEITLTTPDAQERNLPDVTINITVAEKRTLLDETSTVAPVAETNANVRVKRTIKANEWSTLVLPFAMTEAQVKEAFGNDVELADFNGYEAEEDEDGNIVGISVSFKPLAEIEANHPCLIKVGTAISEFTVDGVDIDPEDEPTVAAVKRTKKQWSELVGTYVANTVLDEQMLFLSGNKFWYSNGVVKMKGYRAYFDFYDVLSDVEEQFAAPIRFVFGDETTAIGGVEADKANGDVYTIQGVRIGKADTTSLPKGVYIVGGKKVIVK